MGIPLVDLKAQLARIRPEIEDAVRGVLDSTAFVGGPQLGAFESEFAAFCEARHAVGVSSGTSALHLALIAAGVSEGDEVVVPSHTFIATSEIVRRCGARVRFAEIEETTCTIDPAKLEAVLTPRTRAIVPVHLYGHPADMDPILEIARARGIRIIEDAAQAHGARYKGRRCGGIAPLAAFSFYPGKNLGAYGDGGAVTAAEAAEAERMRRLADHGRAGKHLHSEEGYNYRLDGIQAAILRVKLRHLEAWNDERRRVAAWYEERMRAIPAVRTPSVAAWAEPVWHLYVIRVPNRDRVIAALHDAGVGAGLHYPIPLHLQPAYRSLGHKEGAFPVTERVASEILSLPIYPEITESQVDQVAEALRRAL